MLRAECCRVVRMCFYADSAQGAVFVEMQLKGAVDSAERLLRANVEVTEQIQKFLKTAAGVIIDV